MNFIRLYAAPNFPRIFFILVFVLGLFIYKDFGISWDEKVERLDGAVSLKYVQEMFGFSTEKTNKMLKIQAYDAATNLFEYKDRFYPVGFNLPIEWLIQVFDIDNERGAYLFRHLVTFLISFLGIIAIFSLAKRRFHHWGWGVIAALFFLLSPRFFAEMFYNSKDVVLLAFFAISMNSSIILIRDGKLKWALIHALVSAMAINIRLLALVIPIMTVVALIFRAFVGKLTWRTSISCIFLYTLVLAIFVWGFWPLLWLNPIEQFSAALIFMAKYHFLQDVFYFGKAIPSTQLPWHYLLVWIFFSTPVLYSLLWTLGTYKIILNIVTCRLSIWTNNEQWQDVFFLSLFICPIAGIIFFKSVIYDGWRHVYFIYPAFILVSLRGLEFLWARSKCKYFFRNLIIAAVLVHIAIISWWVYRAHPLQNTYFNFLLGNGWKDKIEVDYWGLSNRQALEWIAQNDKRQQIKVAPGSYMYLGLSREILESNIRDRILIVEDPMHADYIISNYRLNPMEFSVRNPSWRLLKSILVTGELVASIYEPAWLGIEKSLKPNQEIYFSKGSAGIALLNTQDWDLPESWGVWSKGLVGRIVMPNPEWGPQSFTLKMRTLADGNHPEQSFNFYINDLFIGKKIIKNSETFEITLILPAELRGNGADGLLTLKIVSKNSLSPRDLGIGEDIRLLSIGVEGVRFNLGN